MNYFFMAAMATALVGVLPLILKRRYVAAPILGVSSFFVLWGFYYLTTPSTVYPFWGICGVLVIVLWIISAIIDGVKADGITWLAAFPVIGAAIWAGSIIAGWGAFNASTYAAMIGPIEERVWTQDVQPKDPRHMQMVSLATATFLAKKAVAQGGSIGSQFDLDTSSVRLQRVRDDLVYVFPLDFRGYATWSNSDGAPGFIIVYAEDSERTPKLVLLPKEKLMHYTPGAYFNHDLERYMRNNGFLNDGLANFGFELDEQENPFWVVPLYQPTVTWFGPKITGVATVDPTTGKIDRYAAENAPDWIDRIVPSGFVKQYLTSYGEFASGWLNSWWGSVNVTKPEDTNPIYGSDQKVEFVTGMTSHNSNDDSLIGLVYTDTRTAKSVFYRINGGATDSAILRAVNANSQVKFRHLVATTPQIYNVYGSVAAVVPLINDTGAFQGVAIASVTNVQDVAVGATQLEALHNYQPLLSRHGQQIALEKTSGMKKLTGVVDRIRQDLGQNSSVYYLHVAGAPRIFTASSGDYVKLPLTQPGDEVVIDYLASGEDVVPLRSFENLSLSLDKTGIQEEVEHAAAAKHDADSNRKVASTLLEQIKGMKPEEMQRLQDLLRKN